MSNEMKDWLFDQWEDKILEEWREDKDYPVLDGPDMIYYWKRYSRYLLEKLYQTEGVVELLKEKLYG